MFWLYSLTLIFNPTLLPYVFACWWRHGVTWGAVPKQ